MAEFPRLDYFLNRNTWSYPQYCEDILKCFVSLIGILTCLGNKMENKKIDNFRKITVPFVDLNDI